MGNEGNQRQLGMAPVFKDRTLYYNKAWGKGFYALYLESELVDITVQGKGARWHVTAYRRERGDSKIVFERAIGYEEPALVLANRIAAELASAQQDAWEGLLRLK